MTLREKLNSINNAARVRKNIRRATNTMGIMPTEFSVNRYNDPFSNVDDNELNEYFKGKKIVVYTCITGGYDNLIEPKYKSPLIDYICFTDDGSLESKIWEFRPIPDELKELSNVKQQRVIKICPHKYLSNYDISIWVDGCMEIKGNILHFLRYKCVDGHLFVPKHPVRNCIYSEMHACASLKKDILGNMKPQIDRYKTEGYPHNNGLCQTNIVVRYHNNAECIKVMEKWREELLNGSHRDQLSFNYALWSCGSSSLHYLDKNTCNSIYFKWHSAHPKVKKAVSVKCVPPHTLDPNRNIKFCVVHYNTQELTTAMIKSLNIHMPNRKIYLFDNSDVKPFVNTFDNVEVIDNTKGQIINFDEWLKKYPNRVKSPGRVNKWGSAKHSISIEKCMEIIGEPFILLDSDILFKEDISDFYDEEYIYVAMVDTQPSSTIKRVLPFVCFINTPMCKKNNVHYFDDNYMHGLCKTCKSDMYDTGAGFYINSQKLPHLDKDLSKYIIHYKGGSWGGGTPNDKAKKQNISSQEWLENNKNLFE